MAEFVNKGALMKAYKKLPIQKTAEVDCGDGFRNRPLVDLALVYEMICSQPTTTEAELRANVIDEFAEAIIVKATEASEKAIFDGKLLGEALSLDCVSDMVVEIALAMKGEKE